MTEETVDEFVLAQGDDPYRIAATELRNQLLAAYPSETVLTLCALVVGNIAGSVVADGKLEAFLTEIGIAMFREAKHAMEQRDMKRADAAGRQ